MSNISFSCALYDITEIAFLCMVLIQWTMDIFQKIMMVSIIMYQFKSSWPEHHSYNAL